MKRHILQNLGKYAFIVLIIFFVGYLTYDNPKDFITHHHLSEQETAFASVKGDHTLKDSIVAYGVEFLGTPCVTAGSGKDGFDCSGFEYFVFEHFRIKVPCSSAGFEHFRREIPISKVQKGDLV